MEIKQLQLQLNPKKKKGQTERHENSPIVLQNKTLIPLQPKKLKQSSNMQIQVSKHTTESEDIRRSTAKAYESVFDELEIPSMAITIQDQTQTPYIRANNNSNMSTIQQSNSKQS